MIRFLARQPKLMSSITITGLLLCLISITILATKNAPTAKAIGCDGSFPTPQSGAAAYAINWKVTSWLTYNNIPIGPARWTVLGQYKIPNAQAGQPTERCFNEIWKLQKVVRAQSGRSDDDKMQGRGWIIDRGNAADVNSNNLYFDAPIGEIAKNITYWTRDCEELNSGLRLLKGCKLQSQSIKTDPAFSPNASFNTVGMYGILRDDPDVLEFSRSFIPLSWQVDGNF